MTTNFLNSISQCIKFGDLTAVDLPLASQEARMVFADSPFEVTNKNVVFINVPDTIEYHEDGQLTKSEEDALVRESTAGFADWIADFIRRVILLLENLPEEDSEGAVRNGDAESK